MEALDAAVADWWPSTRTATLISVLSTLIAAAALLMTGYTAYTTYQFQKHAKQIDTAVSWCKDFFMPSFVAYQEDVRSLRASPGSLYTLRDVDRNPDTSTLKNADDVRTYLQSKGISDDTQERLIRSLIGLLNYIDTGAEMVARGDMDAPRFVGCFKDFKEQYFQRFDSTYIGLLVSFQATPRGAKLYKAKDIFGTSACVINAATKDPLSCIVDGDAQAAESTAKSRSGGQVIQML